MAIDRKGILSYLLITITITYAIEIALILAGFRWLGIPPLIGQYIIAMSLRNRSSILAGWIHGALNGQGYGVWRILFPDVNPLLGGMTGLVGILVWLAVGLWVARSRI
jgi:hypothetical protein